MMFRQREARRVQYLELQIEELRELLEEQDAEILRFAQQLDRKSSDSSAVKQTAEDADATARDAYRMATEAAKALELVLIDVNSIRRDLDASMGITDWVLVGRRGLCLAAQPAAS